MSDSSDDSRTEDDNDQGKRISLVLGSGGARGLAHIGVIRELEKRGYKIEAIAGCSMGALIGGLYAKGKMEEYADWVTSLDRSDIFGLLDITGSPGGFIAGDKIMEKLESWIGDDDIEDLPIKYTAVAVDIERERELWMSDGSLYDAIRASISIPGVFTPYKYRGRVLIDGGVLNPIPVAPTVDRLTDRTFVVDANGPPTDLISWRKAREASGNGDEKSWFAKALEKIGMGSSGGSAEERKRDVMSILMQSLDTMQAALTRQHLAVFQPDYVFRIPRNLCMIHEFHRAEEIIEMGKKIAQDLLDNPELERRQLP